MLFKQVNDYDMKCIYCKGDCIKKGKIKNVQRYQCKHCGKTQQKRYSKPPIKEEKYERVRNLTKEGSSISSISRLLGISKSSVQRVIERIAAQTELKKEEEKDQEYEVDELRTFCGQKKTKVG
jgi:transposase-like protein